jgi:hypothetical protein
VDQMQEHRSHNAEEGNDRSMVYQPDHFMCLEYGLKSGGQSVFDLCQATRKIEMGSDDFARLLVRASSVHSL